ncbi:MarR family winged helix-turn-helix transcriptional regulator [Desulfosediminicola flagellatus]|uniref:MarR family winged helix-turn-helix transcriptional regulator n=1 Tax=Desulfosediminicola flagellatus TaxID=2569541 RepID=UPI0010ACA92E|nr:MarR family transcriptional regulator [Desulfosediminicola flagellatus]
MKQCNPEPIGRVIYMTTMALKKYLESRLKPYDLTVEQYQVLKSLSEEDGAVQSRLCELVAKSPANITRILDRLAKKEYVERRDNPEDRRSTLVYLTATGEGLLSQVIERLANCESKVTAGISQQEIEQMRRNLKMICSNIDEITGENAR